MNERERLIELLKDNQGDSTYYMTDEAVQSVSDVLLENGVVVLPCKVGDTVYGISRGVIIPKCTELKDKNGKLIFEGDILESRASENKEDWKRWVVQFTDGSFCFEREIPRKRKYKYEQNLLGIDNIELYGLTVIGNIHDNHELLQRSDEE